MHAVTPGPHESDPPAPHEEWSAHRAAVFGALVTAHCDRLCKYAYRYVRSREAAEDVVHEVFTRLWERGDDLVELRDPLPYLYRAVHNRAILHLRRERVHQRWQTRQSLDPPTAEGAHSRTERLDLSRALDRAIADLPERCRQVFTMSREQGLTHAEIARVLGLSVKTVESHVWRAMTALRASVAAYL